MLAFGYKKTIIIFEKNIMVKFIFIFIKIVKSAQIYEENKIHPL